MEYITTAEVFEALPHTMPGVPGVDIGNPAMILGFIAELTADGLQGAAEVVLTEAMTALQDRERAAHRIAGIIHEHRHYKATRLDGESWSKWCARDNAECLPKALATLPAPFAKKH